ncbi:MAG: HDOD domain-containing protein [Planctomycetes bacterium]|nr:HDOD domain-containing protein [Planctomycetota bacterium]
MPLKMDLQILNDTSDFSTFLGRLLERAREPAALPQTLIEVLHLLKDEEQASIKDLSDVLMRDPALTTRILRIANSARYGTRCEITTMHQAVMLLGTKTVSALTLTAGFYDLAGSWKGTMDRVRFWRHSLQTAIAARLIAERVGYASPDEAFVCGLLHDIGILLMENACPDEFATLWKRLESRENVSDEMEVQWRRLHAEVGQAFLSHWNFPAVLCHAIKEHHNGVMARNTDPETRPFRIVALANLISPLPIARSQKVLPSDSRIRQALRVGLHLNPRELRQIMKMLLTQLPAEGEFLEIDIGSHNDYLREANEIIFRQCLEALEDLRTKKRMVNPNMNSFTLDQILTEARESLKNQYLNLCELLGRDWRGETSLAEEGPDMPSSTPATRLLCKQYIAMENVLQTAGKKIEQP